MLFVLIGRVLMLWYRFRLFMLEYKERRPETNYLMRNACICVVLLSRYNFFQWSHMEDVEIIGLVTNIILRLFVSMSFSRSIRLFLIKITYSWSRTITQWLIVNYVENALYKRKEPKTKGRKVCGGGSQNTVRVVRKLLSCFMRFWGSIIRE